MGKSFKYVFTGVTSHAPLDVEMGGVGKEPPSSGLNENKEVEKGRESNILKNGCMSKTKENMGYEITSPKIKNYIQFMKDHMVIRKLMGIRPSEKALVEWVNIIWKINGFIDLKLGSKGFFIVMFSCIEDINRVLEEGIYFFNSKGLHLRH